MSLAPSKQGLPLSPLLHVNFQPPRVTPLISAVNSLVSQTFPEQFQPIHFLPLGISLQWQQWMENRSCTVLGVCLAPVFSSRWEIPPGQGSSLLSSSLSRMTQQGYRQYSLLGKSHFCRPESFLHSVVSCPKS